jgi:hypothetical protein
MSDLFNRLLEEAAGLQLGNSPPFERRSPSGCGASLFASAAPAREVKVGVGASALPGTVPSNVDNVVVNRHNCN